MPHITLEQMTLGRQGANHDLGRAQVYESHREQNPISVPRGTSPPPSVYARQTVRRRDRLGGEMALSSGPPNSTCCGAVIGFVKIIESVYRAELRVH
jgi:hypothetical protein